MVVMGSNLKNNIRLHGPIINKINNEWEGNFLRAEFQLLKAEKHWNSKPFLANSTLTIVSGKNHGGRKKNHECLPY